MSRSNQEFKQENQAAAESTEAQTKREIDIAEKKVAAGIKHLYALYKNKAQFDDNGIATLITTAEDINRMVEGPQGQCRLGDLFPNKLANGISLHFFRPGYTRHPAPLYMAEQKINALCAAMKIMLPKSSGVEIIAQEMGLAAQEELDARTNEIHHSGLTEQQQNDVLHNIVNTLLKTYSQKTAKALYDIAETPMTYDAFAKALLETSSHHRSDTHDTLTFNEETQRFSYDEAANVTAHDREVGCGCPNLSIVFDGNYQEDKGIVYTHVTSSIIKHASPVAIDSIRDKQTSDIDLLLDTCNKIKEIITTMVRLRVHGRQVNDKSPLNINWVYQLLTTNALNLDYQASAYGYIVRAARILNGHTFQIDGIDVTSQIAVMNAGINALGYRNLGYKKNTQQRQNRHAYFQLTDAVSSLEIHPENLTTSQENTHKLTMAFQRIKSALVPPNLAPEEKKQLQDLRDNIIINSNKFIEHAAHYEIEKEKIDIAEKELAHLQEIIANNPSSNFKNEIDAINAGISIYKKDMNDYKETLKNCDKFAEKNYGDTDTILSNLSGMLFSNAKTIRELTNTIENKYRRPHWHAHRTDAFNNIKILQKYFAKNKAEIEERLDNPATRDVTQKEILTISALIYKVYADELYYGDGSEKYAGTYREPKHAAAFNTYLAAYQHNVGMMASMGCKSANDRTYIIRMLYSVIEGRPLTTQPIPPICYGETLPQYIIEQFSNNALTNTALLSCIKDTTTTPKVDAKKFPILEGVAHLDYLNKLGGQATHKMEIKDTSSSSSSRTASKSLFSPPNESDSDSDEEEKNLLTKNTRSDKWHNCSRRNTR